MASPALVAWSRSLSGVRRKLGYLKEDDLMGIGEDEDIAAWMDGETYEKGAAHYIEFEGLREDWRECLRVDYDPVVRIEWIRNLRERAKYTAKTGDYASEGPDGDGYDGDPETGRSQKHRSG